MKSDKPTECTSCNTFDVGSILDNSELTAQLEKGFASRAEAEQGLAFLTEKARETESEPCQIASEIVESEGVFVLKASFTFSCQAEVVIFQLATRTF
ncbi:hypothetical protein B0187_02640 [Haemophilus paracuniculus]|uniref:CHRD domain-containing protein n=1 Tax=Haemophilus paracuniculus TaxID=734 RepID=A0A1T0ATP1_9PAST|nr:DUF406 family protein [Haemophilus paracuniculus]OOR99725.1 hypothetical protein B0187_02640 [Haemophilus paracuniculus]